MTTPRTTTSAHPRRLVRSAAAVFIGFVAVAVLSLATGPDWYPILLALTAVPCSWLGGALYERTRAEQRSFER